MAFTGGGFTPAGPVDLVLPLRTGLAAFETVAGPAGEIAGAPPVPPLEDVLANDEFATDLVVTANDRTRGAAQPPGDPALRVATAAARISRQGVWMTRGKIVAAKPIGIMLVGMTVAVGETVYAHYAVAAGRSSGFASARWPARAATSRRPPPRRACVAEARSLPVHAVYQPRRPEGGRLDHDPDHPRARHSSGYGHAVAGCGSARGEPAGGLRDGPQPLGVARRRERRHAPLPRPAAVPG